MNTANKLILSGMSAMAVIRLMDKHNVPRVDTIDYNECAHSWCLIRIYYMCDGSRLHVDEPHDRMTNHSPSH